MSNTSLVPVFSGTINNSPALLCNARELHKVLQSKQQFTNWIQNRIETYGFVDGEDFLINLLKTPNGRPKTEYHITVGMGKELATLSPIGAIKDSSLDLAYPRNPG